MTEVCNWQERLKKEKKGNRNEQHLEFLFGGKLQHFRRFFIPPLCFKENRNSTGNKIEMLEHCILIFKMKNTGFYFCVCHSQSFLVEMSFTL